MFKSRKTSGSSLHKTTAFEKFKIGAAIGAKAKSCGKTPKGSSKIAYKSSVKAQKRIKKNDRKFLKMIDKRGGFHIW